MIGDELLEQLAPLAYADAEHDGALQKYLAGIGLLLQGIDDWVADGPNGEPGWSQLLDLDRTPLDALPWLAQFKGVTVTDRLPGETDQAYGDRLRARIRSTDGFDRGTPAALVGAASEWLTGDKRVILRERLTTAYHFEIVTFASETPDSAKVLAALLEQKPAGLTMMYAVLTGQDYQILLDNHTPYSDIFADYLTYQGIVTNQPGT